MAKFEIGKCYYMTSVCNHECTWAYEVVARTAKTVTLQLISNHHSEEPIKRRVYEFEGAECVKPLGSYSMAPVLRANRVVMSEELEPSTSVIDFTARLRVKQEKDKIQRAVDTFKTQYLPYLSKKDILTIINTPGDGAVIARICLRIDLERGRVLGPAQ